MMKTKVPVIIEKYETFLKYAVYNILEPIFDKCFYSTSYACRTGRGTHKGVIDVQAEIRRTEKAHGERKLGRQL